MIAYFSMLWGLVVLSLRLILALPLRLPTPLCLRIPRVILSLRPPLQFVHREGVEERRSDTQPFACSFCVSICTFVLVMQVN